MLDFSLKLLYSEYMFCGLYYAMITYTGAVSFGRGLECLEREKCMGKDLTSFGGSQKRLYDNVLKRPVFHKPENYSSYHDGKIAKQIFVKVSKRHGRKT